MSQLKVISLKGKIDEYDPDVLTNGFVQMSGNINPPEAFELRPGISLPVGTLVDVIALVDVHEDGSYNSRCAFGIRTRDGQVCYDLTKDNSKVIPFMVAEEVALFPEAQKLLYK